MSITGYIPTLEAQFTFHDSNSPAATQWGYQFVAYLQKNGTTSKTRYPQGRIDASALTDGSTQTVRFPGVTPGQSYDGFVALADGQGNETPQVPLFTNYAVPKVASGSPVGPIWGKLHHLPVETDPTNGTWNTGTNTFDRGAHHPDFTGTVQSGGGIDFAYNKHINRVPYGHGPQALETAIDSNANLLSTHFAGQTRLLANGNTYAGWEELLGISVYDSTGYHISSSVGNDWLWVEWYTLNSAAVNSATTGCGPAFKDNNGNVIACNFYGGSGDVEYYNGSTWTVEAHPSSNPFSNSTATPQPHTIRAGITAASGNQTRFVIYADSVLVLDATLNIPFIANPPVKPGFIADSPGTQIYVKSYRILSGQVPYEQHAPGIQGAIARDPGSDGLYIKSGQVGRRHVAGFGTGSNLLFNPNGTQNLQGWSAFGSPGGTANWYPDSYSGGRFHCSRSGTTATADYLLYQQFTPAAGGNVTFYGLYEADGMTLGGGGGVWVDVYDTVSGTVLVSAPALTANSPATAWSITANTTAGHTIQLRFRTQFATGDAYFYKPKAEYGTISTPFDDAWTSGIVPLTHDNSGNLDLSRGQSGKLVNYANTSSEYQGNFDINGVLKASTTLKNQGSLLNTIGNPGISWSFPINTQTQLTVPAATFTLTDNSTQISIPQFQQTFTNLTNGSTYYYDVSIDVPNLRYLVNGQPQGSAVAQSTQRSSSQQFADLYKDGRICIAVNFAIQQGNFGAGGSGGGGGGGNCPAVWQLVKTKERGMVRADSLDIGEHLPSPDGWCEIVGLHKKPAPIWHYSVEGDGCVESYDVNDGHAIKTMNGEWIRVCDLKGGEQIVGRDTVLTVVEAHYLRDDYYIELEVAGHEYLLGDALCHNAVTL